MFSIVTVTLASVYVHILLVSRHSDKGIIRVAWIDPKNTTMQAPRLSTEASEAVLTKPVVLELLCPR